MATMSKKILIMALVLHGFFRGLEIDARDSLESVKKSPNITGIELKSGKKQDSFDLSAILQRIEDLKLDELGLLDRFVTTIVSALGIPLKEPPPLDGKRVSRLDERSRTAWYKSLTAAQRKGSNYFNESNQYFDKDPEKALKLVEKCLELFPEFHNAVKDYEILRYELGKPGAKEPDSFRRRRLAKELVSESIGIFFVDSSQALELVHKAIAMDPSYREAYFERDLLECFLENGKLAAEANSEEIAERYFSQGLEMQEHNPEKAMSLMRATLEIKPDNQEAIKLLNNLEESRAVKLFNKGAELVDKDFDSGLKFLEEAINIIPDNTKFKDFMSGLANKLFRRGNKIIKQTPEQAFALIKKSVKYTQRKNPKYEIVLVNLGQELVRKKLKTIISMFDQRDPDELEIINLINKVQYIDPQNKEFLAKKLDFAEKLQSYAKYYFADDHRRALKIITKALELNPSLSIAVQDFNDLLIIESKYLGKQARTLINSFFENPTNKNFKSLSFSLWVLLSESTKSKNVGSSPNFIDELFNNLRELVDDITDKNPKVAYKLMELFNLRYPDHMQSEVEMNKLLDLVANQYHQEAVELYGDNNKLALELLLYGLDFNPDDSNILRDIDYMRSDMGL